MNGNNDRCARLEEQFFREQVRIFVFLMLAVFALPTATWAAEVSQFKGPSTYAEFDSTVDCIETSVMVSASDDVSHNPPGAPGSSSGAAINIAQVDQCSFVLLLQAFGSASLAAPDFQVTAQLTSATLNATINVFDYVSNSSFDVSVNMTWAGTGDLQRVVSNFHVLSPGFKENIRSNGSSRAATATGTVSGYGITNFTPNPSDFANIVNAISGEVVIY